MEFFTNMKAKLSLLMMLAAIFVTGCRNNTPGLLTTIPAESEVVVTVNANKLGENSCLEYDGTRFGLVGELKKYETNKDVRMMLTLLGKVNQVVDLGSAIIFIDEKMCCATFAVVDKNKISQFVNDGSLKMVRTEGDYDSYVFSDNRFSLVLTPAQGWIVAHGCCSVDAIDHVKSVLTKASSKSASELGAVTTCLVAENVLNLAIFDKKYTKNWYCFSGNFEGQSIIASAQAIGQDGKAVALGKNLGKVDDGFLKYIPEDALGVAAISVPSDYPWYDIVNQVSDKLRLGSTDFAVIDVTINYLKKINGTAAFAYTYDVQGSADSDIDDWEYRTLKHFKGIAVAQTSKDNANQMMNLFRNVAKSERSQVEAVGKFNRMSIKTDRGDVEDLYFGYVDGYLIVANYYPQERMTKAAARYKQLVKGNHAVVAAVMPEGLRNVVRFPYGVESSVKLKGNTLSGNLTLIGTQKPFVMAMSDMISEMVKNEKYYNEIVRKAFERDDYVYYYDEYIDSIAVDTVCVEVDSVCCVSPN